MRQVHFRTMATAMLAVVALAASSCSGTFLSDGSGGESGGEEGGGAGSEIGASDAEGGSADATVTNEEPPGEPDDDGGSRDASSSAAARPEACPDPGPSREREGERAEAAVLQPGDGDSPQVRAVVYPHPDHEGAPWSHWGQGLVLDDGRYWSAIGDHLGADGNSYFYDYDPETHVLTRFADVLSNVDHQPGAWGFGKVHGQLVPGPCGEVWAATYWGSRRGLTFGDGYEGDLLLRLDPEAYTIEPIVTPAVERGVPSLAGAPDHGLVYGEAVDPETDDGRFFAVDMFTGEVIVDEAVSGHTGFRNILVDADGAAHIAIGDHRLARYEPGADALTTSEARLPGTWLRASTGPTDEGTVYGVTRDPDRFFALEADGTVRDLGDARGYVASMALLPDGDGFVYVPGAHGHSWEQGTPLFAVDGATGEHRTLVEMADAAAATLDLRLGGTYSVAVDARERRAFVTMNAGEAGEETFGEVVLLIVELT